MARTTSCPGHQNASELAPGFFTSDPLQPGTEPLPVVSTVQVTSDLTVQTDPWHAGQAYTSVVSQIANGKVTQVMVMDNTAIATVSKRFIRLQVSEN